MPHTNEIVFLRSRALEKSSPAAEARRRKYDVYAVDRTTREVTRLTHQEYPTINWLSVSADGRQLVLSVYDGHRYDFIVSSIDSADASTRQFRPRPFASIMHAAWLPDGRSLLFMGTTAHGAQYEYDVYRLTLGSGDIRPVTHLDGISTGFSVSADGSKVVVLYQGAYRVVDLETGRVTLVPPKF